GATAAPQANASTPSARGALAAPSTGSAPAAAPGGTSTPGASGPQPLGAGGGGGGGAPNLLPELIPGSAGPSQLVPASAGGDGGNPGAGAYSQSGVRYADGAISVNRIDVSSLGFGTPFLQGGDWSNASGYAAGAPEGNGWQTPQLPVLEQANSGATV